MSPGSRRQALPKRSGLMCATGCLSSLPHPDLGRREPSRAKRCAIAGRLGRVPNVSWLSHRRAAGESARLTLGLGAGRSARLEDEFLDRYVCWREACEEVRVAYEHWESSRVGDRAGAFVAYQAALDREESAARDYGQIVEQLRARVG